MNRRVFLKSSGALFAARYLSAQTCCLGCADELQRGVQVLPDWLKQTPVAFGQAPPSFYDFHPQATNPLQARNVISSLTADSAAQFVRAYKHMRCDSGPAGFACQAAVHYVHCDPNHSIHVPDLGRFLAWHRAYLYFHERLLQWHLMNADQTTEPVARTWRLPYWHVPSTAAVSVPAIFSSDPAVGDFPVRNAPNGSLNNIALAAGIKGADLQEITQCLMGWHFGGHTAFHNCNMQLIQKSALDPLFYAWHSNVDRMWTHAKSFPEQLEDGLYVFFDAWTQGGTWVRANLKEFADPAVLEYSYFEPSDVAMDLQSVLNNPHFAGPRLWISDLALPNSPQGRYAIVLPGFLRDHRLAEVGVPHNEGHKHNGGRTAISFFVDAAFASQFDSSHRPRLFVKALDTHERHEITSRIEVRGR